VSARAEDYYLVVSRLIPYKRIDWPWTRSRGWASASRSSAAAGGLRRCADGRAQRRVRRSGFDAELKRLYAGCRALVFPGEEDFGSRRSRPMRAVGR